LKREQRNCLTKMPLGFAEIQGCLSLIILSILITGCLGGDTRDSGRVEAAESEGVLNSSATVNIGNGRILRANPIVLSGNTELSQDINLNTLLVNAQDFIVDAQFLEGSCRGDRNTGFGGIGKCFEVRATATSNLLASPSHKWGFTANSQEFLEVNVFAHTRIIADKYLKNVNDIFDFANPSLAPSFPGQYPHHVGLGLFASKSTGRLKFMG